PLPPAEAMACGCIVVGYHGGGGEEYFKNEFSYAINFGDIIAFAQKVEELISQYNNNITPFLDRMKAASSYILSTYSEENERLVLENAWKKLIR
ncbi:MAG: glycosyltransferase, partial [Cytophagales bacterium]|nr:glycosyltransferase [Cytophagales bacterium]